jgi:hypothetical protein
MGMILFFWTLSYEEKSLPVKGLAKPFPDLFMINQNPEKITPLDREVL